MRKIEKLQENIQIGVRMRKSYREDELLSRCESALCRKLDISYSVVTGEYNGYGYERLGVSIDEDEETMKNKLNKHLSILRRELKKINSKPQKKGITAKERVEKMIKENEKLAVAVALYNLNKIAKKYRDQQVEMMDRIYNQDSEDDYDDYYNDRPRRSGTTSQHEALHTAKIRKEYLYEEKDKFLTKVMKKYKILSKGYHVFGDGTKRDMVTLEGFDFHKNENCSRKNLGEIENAITSEKTKAKKLSEASVFMILETTFNKA